MDGIRWVEMFSLLLAGALAGCTTDLIPALSAQKINNQEKAARATIAGVRLTVQIGNWPGPALIDEVVTPVRIVLENNSDKPLRIGYSSFSLIAEGQRFSAVPPPQIEGSVAQPLAAGGLPPAIPAYGPSYAGGVRPFSDTFFYDQHYTGYSHYWVMVDLPTEEMLKRAVPEGVLNHGGRIDGYLYFKKLSNDPRRIDFLCNLVSAETGNSLGEILIPFVAD